MCGRYRQTTQEGELARIYHVPIPAAIRPSDLLERRAEPAALRRDGETGDYVWRQNRRVGSEKLIFFGIQTASFLL
jgi:hypothetical protein